MLDVNLGGMSGIELGQRLEAEGRAAPFICITSADAPTALASRSRGLRGILP